MYIYIYLYTYVYTYIYIYTCVYVNIYVFIRFYMYTQVYTHAYIYMYIHIYARLTGSDLCHASSYVLKIHSSLCHDSSSCVTWLGRMCDMTHSYVRRPSILWPWHLPVCDIMRSSMSHDSFRRHSQGSRAMTHHHVCDMTRTQFSVCAMSGSCVFVTVQDLRWQVRLVLDGPLLWEGFWDIHLDPFKFTNVARSLCACVCVRMCVCVCVYACACVRVSDIHLNSLKFTNVVDSYSHPSHFHAAAFVRVPVLEVAIRHPRKKEGKVPLLLWQVSFISVSLSLFLRLTHAHAHAEIDIDTNTHSLAQEGAVTCVMCLILRPVSFISGIRSICAKWLVGRTTQSIPCCLVRHGTCAVTCLIQM